MKKSVLLAAAIGVGLVFAGAPAYADHCPKDIKLIKAAMKTLTTKGMSFQVRGNQAETQRLKKEAQEEMAAKRKQVQKFLKKGNKLHKQKKHAESLEALHKAMELAGVDHP